MDDGSFIETINALFGGAITTLIGAFTGRLMYHSGEVSLGRRRFFGRELLWEVPVAIGMARPAGQHRAGGHTGLSRPARRRGCDLRLAQAQEVVNGLKADPQVTSGIRKDASKRAQGG